MTTPLEPLHIATLFLTYVEKTPFRANEGLAEYYNRLESDGLITRIPATASIYGMPTEPQLWECTPKGLAHIEQLCRLPYPTQAWVSSSGQIIKS